MECQNFSGCPVNEDYLSTAAHIFERCPVEATLLPVNIIKQNLSSIIKTETKCDYKHLISLLDPDNVNPSITVKHLADALEMLSLHHSHNQSDLDESFNLISRNSFVMRESDPGEPDARSQARKINGYCISLCYGVLRWLLLWFWDTLTGLISTILCCLLIMAGSMVLVLLYKVCTQGFSSQRCSGDFKLDITLRDLFDSIVEYKEYVGQVPT